MFKIFGRPIVAIAGYDADKEQPIEPLTFVQQREYSIPGFKQRGKTTTMVKVRKIEKPGEEKANEVEKANAKVEAGNDGAGKKCGCCCGGHGGDKGNGGAEKKNGNGGKKEDGKAEEKKGNAAGGGDKGSNLPISTMTAADNFPAGRGR